MPTYHVPVLLEEVLQAAGPARRIVDATLGGGGHAAAFLERDGTVLLGIDRDPEAIAQARAKLGPDVSCIEAPYDAPEVDAQVRAFQPDFVLMDLGVSSRHFDDPERGFTFRPGAPLDMRMGDTGPSAAEYLAHTSQEELERTFRDLADERQARRLAREICRRRERAPFLVSDDLVNAIRAVRGPRAGPGDFARIFQAVRMAVNDELEGLARALPAFRDALVPGGALAVISYHSGEDRVVKRAFQDWARACICPPHQPQCTCRGRPLGRLDPRKPIVPKETEVAANPRARSAKLRVFRKAEA